MTGTMRYTWEEAMIAGVEFVVELDIDYQASPVIPETHESPQEGGDVSVEAVRVLSVDPVIKGLSRADSGLSPLPVHPVVKLIWKRRFDHRMETDEDFHDTILMHLEEHADEEASHERDKWEAAAEEKWEARREENR